MKTRMTLVLAIGSVLLSGHCVAQEEEHPLLTRSSPQFIQGAGDAIKALSDKNFEDGLASPGLGAENSGEYERIRAAILREPVIADVDTATPGIEYDVILQPGHYFRKTGRTGTAGSEVSERALVNFITTVAAAELRKRHVKVAVVSADTPLRDDRRTPAFEGLSARVFLAIHADGATPPCHTGPSLAYERKSSTLAMHAIGWGLGQALGYTYEDFMKDNFTAAEAKYYMFREVHTSVMSGLLEVGELTCAKTEKRLVSGAEMIGKNVARALEFIVGAP